MGPWNAREETVYGMKGREEMHGEEIGLGRRLNRSGSIEEEDDMRERI